jgi:hypothetical protein
MRSPSPTATDKRLTLRVADVRLESALCLALSSEMPSATWRDGELVIALGAAAPARMESAVHPIPQSLLEPIHGFDEQRIAELVSSIVVPESWDDVGGPGHVRAVPGALIVTQTHELQQETAAVLTALNNVAVARQPWSPDLAASAASPASAAIVRALESNVTLRADEQPLEEFLNAVAAEHGINVVIDRQTWWEEKLANRCRVSVDAHDARLRDALRQALADCHLTFFLWHEALLVTSMQEASEALRMHFYPLPEGVNEPDEFMDVLTLHVEPESW